MTTQNSAVSTISTSRAEQLQFLRFLAFMNVYICHAEYWNFMNYPASHCAYSAVSFFFMLSGLVAGYSQYGKEISPTPTNIIKDMWKRLKKLYPLYLFMVLLGLVFSGIPRNIAAAEWENVKIHIPGLIENLLLIQSWPGGQRFMWFMSTIVFLYLLTLPGLWFASKARGHRFRYLIWGGSFLFLMVAIVVYCRMTQHLHMYYWHYIFPPARIGEFLGGILLGYAIRDFMSQPILQKIPKMLFTLAEIAVLIFWFLSLRRPGNYWMNHTVSWLIPNTLVLTAFTFGRGGVSSIFRWKPLVYLGNISFECYIVHQDIIQGCYLLNPTSVETTPAQIYSFFACLLLTIYASALVHRAGSSRRIARG